MSKMKATEILKQKDLLSFVDKLEEYLNEVEADKKDRRDLLRNFFETLDLFSTMQIEMASQDNKHIICEGKLSVLKYTKLTIPRLTSTAKTIVNLRQYIADIKSKFEEPTGKVITVGEIESVMEYLDDRYDFTNVVMPDKAPVFAIINNTNIYCNNESTGVDMSGGIQNVFFLYNMNNKPLLLGMDIEKSPIAILFHELGHALYFKYAGYEEVVPSSILEKLEKLAPNIFTISYQEQCEVLADTFAMGMLNGSPFENEDSFPLDKTLKVYFDELVNTIFDEMKRDKN